jgi:hypothetical protein
MVSLGCLARRHLRRTYRAIARPPGEADLSRRTLGEGGPLGQRSSFTSDFAKASADRPRA